MLYIIGGTSRSGKTTIARNMLNEIKTPYLSLDWLVMGFTNGIPEYGIHDQLFPDEIAKRMWSFVKSMVENIIWLGIDYVIEGEAILPKHINELIEKYPNKVKACFSGYTDIEVSVKFHDIKAFSEGPTDWLSSESDEYIINHINNMVKYSIKIKEECITNKIKYFDTSYNFTDTIDEAVRYLVKC
jgi:2-phosphoglycerate kinase